MAIIENPPSSLVPQLQGVHMFGFDGAPCSQRVSFALAEKGLLRGKKVPHLSAAAAHLQARDGTYTHIESMDIVAYLDEIRPENPLLPTDPTRAALCDELIELGKSLHVSVRHVTFNWTLGNLAKTDAKTEAEVRRLEQADSPEKLADFYQHFNSDAIAATTFIEHLGKLEQGYGEQNVRLRDSGQPFLTGQTFSAADIIWGIKVLRLYECGYPFASNFPDLAAWFERVRARPGFKDGVMANHRLFHTVFRLKARVEHLFGGGISKSSRAAA